MHDGPVHRHPLQAQLTGGFHRYERVRRYPASVEFVHVGSPHDRASSVLRFRPPRFASLGVSLDNRPRPTTAASSMTGRSIGPSRENGGRTPDGRRVGFRRVDDSLPAKTPRTVDRASPHSSSSSSSVAVPIRIITAGPTSRGRVFQRCIGQLTRRALLLGHGTARRPKNSSHHHSSSVDQRGQGQGILHTRRRPRALFLVSSPGGIVPDDASSPSLQQKS